MYFDQFIEMLEKSIISKLEEGYELSLTTTIKNNGVKLKGAVIRKEGINVAPTVYLNNLYERYDDGDDIEDIADYVISLSESYRPKDSFDMSFFGDYERVKDYIYIKVINYISNEELLRDTPYVRFLDLAVVMYCDVSDTWGMPATVLIKNNHADVWGENPKEMIDYAVKNTRNNKKIQILDLAKIIQDNICYDIDDCPEINKMYVITNEEKQYGAAAILYEDVIKSFCVERKSDVFIIPSSIHEIILLPTYDKENAESLNSIVTAVNQELDKEEILSDHIYYYSISDRYEMI